MNASSPMIIGHRGACGLRPEHTLAAYELAIDLGADFIEPDLVPTKDGVLVSRHENDIANTTDVADHPEFAGRRATKVVDGQTITGWFTEDFTFQELKTLRCKEPNPLYRPASRAYDGQFSILSLEEILALVKRKADEMGRTVGIYPEVKHATYFRSVGLSIEERLIQSLRENNADAGVPVFIQSFEVSSLQTLHPLAGDIPLVLLVDAKGKPYDFTAQGVDRDFASLMTPAGLTEVAEYARVIAPNKDMILPPDAQGYLTQPTTLVDDAHAAGLLVHPWTFRNENILLLPGLNGNAQEEYRLFFEAGVDGMLSDHPGAGVAARAAWKGPA